MSATQLKLVIGNKNYSTWSLRPWLMLSAFAVEFEEVHESLHAQGLSERLGKHSPSNKVPVLIDGEICIWDSLAICEYLSETRLNSEGWPESPKARAEARAISAEMHSSFVALRAELPMNCRVRRKVDLSQAALADVAHIDAIWRRCRQQYGRTGPWLFGQFSIADCFYAPVALRFSTYGIPLSKESQSYMDAVLDHPCIIDWVKAACAETEIVKQGEAGIDIS